MNNLTKLPILILSSPRTGSTAFGSYIKSLFDDSVQFFLEPDYTGTIPKFQQYYNSNNKFILKCHLYNLHRYGNNIATELSYSDAVFRIRIRKRDVISQIASFYIAKCRNNKWHYRHSAETKRVDTIPIDLEKLNFCVRYIIDNNKILDDTDIIFDKDLFYEDIEYFDNKTYYKTPQPNNYEDILVHIKKLLD